MPDQYKRDVAREQELKKRFRDHVKPSKGVGLKVSPGIIGAGVGAPSSFLDRDEFKGLAEDALTPRDMPYLPTGEFRTTRGNPRFWEKFNIHPEDAHIVSKGLRDALEHQVSKGLVSRI